MIIDCTIYAGYLFVVGFGFLFERLYDIYYLNIVNKHDD